MPDNLLGLLLAEHLLGGSEQRIQGKLAEFLLLEVLGDIHAHAQLFVSLPDLVQHGVGSTSQHVPEGDTGQACPRAQLSFELEIERLLF